MTVEILRVRRYAARSPVLRRSDDQRSRVAELAMHEVVRLGPSMENEDVRDLCVCIGHPVDDADIDLDVGAARMKSRQRGHQHVKRELRVCRDDQRPGGSLRGSANRFVDGGQLAEQWTTGLEIGLPACRQREAANAAFEQRSAKVSLQDGHQLVNRRHAHLETARGAGEAALLGAGDEVAQRAKLVHRKRILR